MSDQPPTIVPPAAALQSTGRRTALARWIVDPENPLTARVIVNRIWQQHFGRGLVSTTSDFGHLGTTPSHPELLDWLAGRFVADGWSLKKLHRLILTSATYRQSSTRQPNEKLAKLDPQNSLLWRMNPRRLSAEEIHDSMLSASRELGAKKRAIYKPVKRNQLDPLLTAFDFPDRVESQCRRHSTTTAPQSLLLMNNPWLRDCAKAMSKDLGSMSLDSVVEAAYRRLYFRPPDQQEQQQADSFFQSYLSITPEPESPNRVQSMPDGRPAISLVPDQAISIQVPSIAELRSDPDDEDFTVEAIVLLRSLYSDASVRTIVTGWTGNNSQPGWALGVTSTKSSYQPRNLILQLVGSRNAATNRPEYEVVASNLRLELNKPYHVAVSIDVDDTSDSGIAFYLQDLTTPDAKPLRATVAHQARRNLHSDGPIQIGSRSKHHRWDGLIHQVRIHGSLLSDQQLFGDQVSDKSNAEQNRSSDELLNITFSGASRLGYDASRYARHAVVTAKNDLLPAHDQARIALLHALLNANELIYVD